MNNTTSDNKAADITIGELTGSGTLRGKGTYTIGANGTDIDFKGQINSPVRKTGNGTWTVRFDNPQNNIGAISIDEGKLYLYTTYGTASVLGGNTVTANCNAAITGVGTVATLTLNSGAELTPGLSGTTAPTGFLGAEKIINAKAGSMINLHIKNALNTNFSRTFIKAGTHIMLNGKVSITLSPDYAPKTGDEIILWTCQNFNGNPVVVLPELPDGLAWDKSDLLKATGILRVVDSATGIAPDPCGSPAHCRLFTTSGILVEEFDSASNEIMNRIGSIAVSKGTYILQIITEKGVRSKKIKK